MSSDRSEPTARRNEDRVSDGQLVVRTTHVSVDEMKVLEASRAQVDRLADDFRAEAAAVRERERRRLTALSTEELVAELRVRAQSVNGTGDDMMGEEDELLLNEAAGRLASQVETNIVAGQPTATEADERQLLRIMPRCTSG
jgi:hypothetical protein